MLYRSIEAWNILEKAGVESGKQEIRNRSPFLPLPFTPSSYKTPTFMQVSSSSNSIKPLSNKLFRKPTLNEVERERNCRRREHIFQNRYEYFFYHKRMNGGGMAKEIGES
ncbi:hypothetical protein CDAR_258061 [Caerostris darwini]|uniref:Uncharacterized protein n=1 Tax=Caerostris darwini TaxID=1538125 RepID=A0AAV4WWF3_9ARAC|nr:hypothetical protein CDAR_258061 [Caerostris darwini]